MLYSIVYAFARLLIDALIYRDRSEARLRAEVLARRHQLRVLERQTSRPRWQPIDRLLLAAQYAHIVPRWGSMLLMARSKATITLDRDKVATAGTLIGSQSMSDVIDVALDRLIRAEQLRSDVEAYSRKPLSDEELAVADLPVHFDLDDEDVDYEALYGR